MHSKHKWGFCGAAGAPLAGGRLGVNVEHNGGPAGLLDSDGKGEGERGFPAPAFLRDDRYCIQHGVLYPCCYCLNGLVALHRREHKPADARRDETEDP